MGIKGGWLCGGHVLHTYPSEMAQNFWAAIFAWTVCFLVTIAVSLFTKPKPEAELRNLVMGLTPLPDEGPCPWYQRPMLWAALLAAALVAVNVIFW